MKSQFINTIQNIAGALFGANTARKGQQRTFENNRRLMQMQQRYDKQMYDYQNAYNTPANQMQRLKDAGLNPALMYGQGTTGNASNQPKAQTIPTTFSGLEIAQSAAAGAQLSVMNAQRRNLEANAALTTAETAIKVGSKDDAVRLVKNQADNILQDTNVKIQNIANQKTINALNQQYLKLEKAGLHKGNIAATLMKSVFGLDLKTEQGQKTAQYVIGALLGSRVANELSGAVRNLFNAFKPSATINKTTTIGEIFNNK